MLTKERIEHIVHKNAKELCKGNRSYSAGELRGFRLSEKITPAQARLIKKIIHLAERGTIKV
jgi:hypothetical protein